MDQLQWIFETLPPHLKEIVKTAVNTWLEQKNDAQLIAFFTSLLHDKYNQASIEAFLTRMLRYLLYSQTRSHDSLFQEFYEMIQKICSPEAAARIIECNDSKAFHGLENNLLHLAVLQQNMTVINFLMNKNNYFFNSTNELGQNIFHIAAQVDNIKIFEFLLSQTKPFDHKKMLQQKDKDHNTSINIAIQKHCFTIVEYLLRERNKYFSITELFTKSDHYQATLLHEAIDSISTVKLDEINAAHFLLEIIDYLLFKAPELLTIKDSENRSPLAHLMFKLKEHTRMMNTYKSPPVITLPRLFRVRSLLLIQYEKQQINSEEDKLTSLNDDLRMTMQNTYNTMQHNYQLKQKMFQDYNQTISEQMIPHASLEQPQRDYRHHPAIEFAFKLSPLECKKLNEELLSFSSKIEDKVPLETKESLQVYYINDEWINKRFPPTIQQYSFMKGVLTPKECNRLIKLLEWKEKVFSKKNALSLDTKDKNKPPKDLFLKYNW